MNDVIAYIGGFLIFLLMINIILFIWFFNLFMGKIILSNLFLILFVLFIKMSLYTNKENDK